MHCGRTLQKKTHEIMATIHVVRKGTWHYNRQLPTYSVKRYSTDEEIIQKTDKIGRYRLPFNVFIKFESEEDVICAVCKELEIVSCATTYKEAKFSLEAELKDAIDLYVHVLKESELDSNAKEYRKKLSEIERMNAS